MSKCGKNKKVAHQVIAECVTDILAAFWRPLWSITEQAHGYMEETNYLVLLFFILKSFKITQKLAFTHFGKHKKSHLM